jgi:DNA-binding NarL/FixJ family response regulator
VKVKKLNPLFAHLAYHLSEREEQVLLLAVQGLSNPEIGRVVGNSENTVKHHMSSVFDKTGMSSRVELVNWYRDLLEKDRTSRNAQQCPAPPTES